MFKASANVAHSVGRVVFRTHLRVLVQVAETVRWVVAFFTLESHVGTCTRCMLGGAPGRALETGGKLVVSEFPGSWGCIETKKMTPLGLK